MSIRKETILDGYFAAGDCECFCFDKHDGPWECPNPGGDDCCVYPNALIPDEAQGRGRWRIVVEFTPEDGPG